MARIRTVKPAFLRHEKLQDLEHENPGQYIMIVFMGLWMLADSKGRFEYKPRSIKLDILPFLDYDMQKSLEVLEKNGFIRSYEVNGCRYGIVPTFRDHQRITGKELTEGEKFPAEPDLNVQEADGETLVKHPVVQERKGREQEEEQDEEGSMGEKAPLSEINFDLRDKVMKYFGFNEMANFDKLRVVSAFVRCLQHSDRLVYFEEQFDAYVAFKTINDSFPHSFKKFLGTDEQLFQDGAWNGENWIRKLEAEKEKKAVRKTKVLHSSSRGVEAAMEWGNIERRGS
ncbi:hypothetical protein DBR43_19950 [Pedobacter sp. KBW06]|uniref:hypothetical protein n=1 Tax=Pedobacter sp. KBW06 TaxID=2153359 RepID=UPI000F59E74C|nr:hypothetical protein [Pedobacter sp. KBW06]RQO70297.1 hypothetical protein DBR43_19950 [Pedobacter sp. KBW06]